VEKMKRVRAGNNGFTRIEFMLLLLIIAVIMAIAVPVYLSTLNSAKTKKCQSNQRTIDSAINAYDGYYDVWPGDGPVADTLGPMWLKQVLRCPASPAPGTYSLGGADVAAGVPPATSCPGGIPSHVVPPQ
jgi:type IV pilus assembly protein PilA